MPITEANKKKCKSCIFREDDQAIKLSPGRKAEIQTYLLEGTNHVCHQTDKTCRGGREFQAEMWYRLGLLKEPTVACLEETVNRANKK